jgi:predicted nucleic acid-binding protein
MPTVLCNSGPLMALGKLNRLDLLANLYGEVQIPRAVYDEAVTQGLVRGAPDALTIRLFWQRQQWPIVDVPEVVLSAYTPPVILGPGETEVLALAQTLTDPLVLLDDEVARAEARRLKLRLRGTLGILVHAYRKGLLSFGQVELLIREVAARPDIWIGARLCEQVLALLRQSEEQPEEQPEEQLAPALRRRERR